MYTTRPKSLSHPGFLVETQLLKPISFSSRRMVRAEIFLGTFVEHAIVSCWTLFRRFTFTNRFREHLSRVFRTLALSPSPRNECTSPSFFPLGNCSLHCRKSYGHHLRHISGGLPSPVQTCNLSFGEDRGSFVGFFLAWLLMLVVAAVLNLALIVIRLG